MQVGFELEEIQRFVSSNICLKYRHPLTLVPVLAFRPALMLRG